MHRTMINTILKQMLMKIKFKLPILFTHTRARTQKPCHLFIKWKWLIYTFMSIWYGIFAFHAILHPIHYTFHIPHSLNCNEFIYLKLTSSFMFKLPLIIYIIYQASCVSALCCYAVCEDAFLVVIVVGVVLLMPLCPQKLNWVVLIAWWHY